MSACQAARRRSRRPCPALVRHAGRCDNRTSRALYLPATADTITQHSARVSCLPTTAPASKLYVASEGWGRGDGESPGLVFDVRKQVRGEF